jgi:hypothetical protein
MNNRLLKIITVFLLPMFFSLLPLPAAAEGDTSSVPLQFISLNDGTLIRGRLVSVQNGAYIIQTEHLGEIRVNPADIQSISSGNFQRKEEAPARLPILGGNLSPGTQILNSPDALQAVQQTLMSDPQILTLIQDLMADPDVVKIIQDSNLMKDLSTLDPGTIQQNPDFQRLLQHPKIKEIIKTFTQKHIQLP